MHLGLQRDCRNSCYETRAYHCAYHRRGCWRHRSTARRPLAGAAARAGARRSNRDNRHPRRQFRYRDGPCGRRAGSALADLADSRCWSQLHPQKRSARRHPRSRRLDRARPVFFRRANSGSQADQGQGLRLHGGYLAVWNAGDFGGDFPGDRRRGGSSSRTTTSMSFFLAATRWRRRAQASRSIPAR